MSNGHAFSRILGQLQDPPMAVIGSIGGGAFGCVFTALAGAQGFSGLLLLFIAAGIGSVLGYRIVVTLDAKFGKHPTPKYMRDH